MRCSEFKPRPERRNIANRTIVWARMMAYDNFGGREDACAGYASPFQHAEIVRRTCLMNGQFNGV